MDPHELLRQVTARLTVLAQDALSDLLGRLPQPADDPTAAGTPLAGRLLSAHDRLPPGNPLVELVREMLGDLGEGSPVRLHGWRSRPGAPLGVALVLTDPAGPGAGRAVLGMSLPGPVFDLVVTAGSHLGVPQQQTGPWSFQAAVDSAAGWDATFGPGLPPIPPGGTATVRLVRTGGLTAGMAGGPGLRVDGVILTLGVSPGEQPGVDLELRNVSVAGLPTALARLVGIGGSTPMSGVGDAVHVALRADRVHGLRFTRTQSLKVPLPLRLSSPGLSSRGAAVELAADGGDPRLVVTVSLTAGLPGLPLRVSLEGAGFELPVPLSPQVAVGVDPRGLRDVFPSAIGTEIALPPVSGAGMVRRTSDGGYAGMVSVDLGVLRVEAFALFRPPQGTAPTSFLVLLSAQFPPPGIQLGLGFALDAVGGLVGINRAVQVEELRRLVSDGNADTVLFPTDTAQRGAQIVDSLAGAFPVATGRMLVGPMVRITWGGRMVALSGALILELPAPVRATLLGRLLVCVPDPVVPLIRLQASVLGRFDPSVPVVELLVSLAGSWMVGLALRGEMYLLVRGGTDPLFVLSAGGFHPRYPRPAGVPVLQRLQIDLAPGGVFGLRMEAYFAITSNAVMFGGQVQLDATIAGCGVQGWLSLDALFVFEPVFSFAVHVRAGVAVRAFGKRLAGIGLDFTLEGPAPWHAFGTGSISVLFWDVDLDFDIRWGSPPAVAPPAGRDPELPLREAIARTTAWTAERPAVERTALRFTPAATTRLATGDLVHPDAVLRVSQDVVPLGVPISRFERRPVPVQSWTIQAVTLGAPIPNETLTSLASRFVPGEYFDLTETEKLTSPGFALHAGGVRVETRGSAIGEGHRMEDGYETAYEPPLPEREFSGWAGRFDAEAVHAVSAAQRLDRWHATRILVEVRQPSLTLATTADLRPMIQDVTLVDATADPWQNLRDRLDDPNVAVELVESWEVGR